MCESSHRLGGDVVLVVFDRHGYGGVAWANDVLEIGASPAVVSPNRWLWLVQYAALAPQLRLPTNSFRNAKTSV